MSTEKIIWDYLIKSGMTDEGASGMIGNLYAESGLNSGKCEKLCLNRHIFKGCKIYVSLGDSVTVGYCLTHEIGHFLYNETRPSWSEEAKLRFTDDEMFARMYGSYYTFHNQSQEDARLFSEIEKVTEKLVEK